MTNYGLSTSFKYTMLSVMYIKQKKEKTKRHEKKRKKEKGKMKTTSNMQKSAKIHSVLNITINIISFLYFLLLVRNTYVHVFI